MKDYTELVLDFTAISDSARTEALRELHTQWLETEPRYFDFIHCAMPIGGRPHPLSCHGARLIVHPFPPALDGGSPLEREVEARLHIADCPECRSWYDAGSPYHFDMTWNTDREVFCRCVEFALHHQEDWPLSYEAACAHAEHCDSCRKWRDHIEASRSCEATRALLGKNEVRLAYVLHPMPFDAIDAHVDNCEVCQEWCSGSVTCDEARKSMRRIVAGNESEWKIYRHETLAPLERYHLMRCGTCQLWILNNVSPGVASRPIFEAVDGKTADEESDSWARELQHTLRMLIIATDRLIRSCGMPTDLRDTNTPLSEVGFSIGTLECLERGGFKYIEELAIKCEDELSRLRDFHHHRRVETQRDHEASGRTEAPE